MSGVYTVPFAYTGNASVDLSEIVAAAGKPCLILGYDIGQTSDVGDAAEEILALTIKSGQTTSGSGGSSVTPAPTDPVGGVAASFAAEQANTTKASGGTIVTHVTLPWNVRQPDRVLFSPEQQIMVGAGRRATLEIPAAVDPLTIAGQLWVQEIG